MPQQTQDPRTQPRRIPDPGVGIPPPLQVPQRPSVGPQFQIPGLPQGPQTLQQQVQEAIHPQPLPEIPEARIDPDSPEQLRVEGFNDKDIQFLREAIQSGVPREKARLWLTEINQRFPKANDPSLTKGGMVKNTAIDILAPILSKAVGSGVTALTGSPALGTGAYFGTGMGLQSQRTRPAPGYFSKELKFEPGGAASLATNTAEQWALDRLFNTFGNLTNPAKDTINELKPTASQLYEFFKGKGLISGGMKMFEDYFSGATAPETRKQSARIAEDLAVSRFARTSRDNLRDKESFFDLFQRKLPFRKTSEVLPSKTAPYTPITIKMKPTFDFEEDSTTGYRVAKQTGEEVDRIIPGKRTMQAEIPGTSKVIEFPFARNAKQLDEVLRDSDQVEHMLQRATMRGGSRDAEAIRQQLGEYRFAQIWNQHVTKDPKNPSDFIVNSRNLRNALEDPKMAKSHSLIWTAKQRSDYSQFFQNLAHTQDKPKDPNLFMRAGPYGLWIGGNSLNTILRAAGGGTSAQKALAASSVIQVGAVGVGKLLANPRTARFMVNLAGGEPLPAKSRGMAISYLLNLLNGTRVGYKNKQNEERTGMIENGQLVPLNQPAVQVGPQPQQ